MNKIEQYETRPETFEAIRITHADIQEAARWCNGRVVTDAKSSDPTDIHEYLLVPTVDGNLKLELNDYLVRSASTGEFKGVEGNAFQNTYRWTGRQAISTSLWGATS